jgi:hypothetical protein
MPLSSASGSPGSGQLTSPYAAPSNRAVNPGNTLGKQCEPAKADGDSGKAREQAYLVIWRQGGRGCYKIAAIVRQLLLLRPALLGGVHF